MKRYHLIAKGRVQGVGFRFFCQYTALQHDLTGYAKNLYDGDVEIEVQGTEQNIRSFIEQVKKGNRFISVHTLEKKEMPYLEKERGFRSK